MELSVVTTLYKSENFLKKFISETLKVISQIDIKEYEIIFVNDGSPDNSLQYLLSRKQEIPQIKIINLSRNFGHHYAIQAGLREVKGNYVFLIDNDLEISPSVLKTFYKEIEGNPELDVVFGVQETRKGNFIEKRLGGLFWILINKLSDTKIPHNILTERLMTKGYVKALLSLGDVNLFLGGMMHWVGFNQKGILIAKVQREGVSTYTTRKRIELMIQAITSFSGKPLVWLFNFGLIVSFMSLIFILFLLVKKIIYQDVVQIGWTSILAVSLLILGVLSVFLGIIGMYIYKIFKQVQGRPNVIVKNIYN